MVEREFKQKYGEQIDKISERLKKEKNSFRTVALFFSFDIVNSSTYKDLDFLGWQRVLTKLLADIHKNIAKEIPQAQLWRVLGDEIIFFLTLKNIEEIYISIDSIYKVLIRENAKLSKECYSEDAESNKGVFDGYNILGVQSAAWIAIIHSGDMTDFKIYDNIFKQYNINESQKINEFLGQDIDTGFRIKKETQKRRLVISIELAKLLSERTEYLAKLFIITYKSLKGVWKNRLYPIIWYYDTKISGGISFDESFYYDEINSSPLSKDYFLNHHKSVDNNLAKYMYLDVNKALNKVILDQNLEKKITCIKNVITETEDDRKVEEEFHNKLLEFHCAVVCCDIENRKILIVKRKDRKFLSGLWEFGCSKANIEQSLVDSSMVEYKNDFGIDIEVVCDREREDIEPKPIALYQIDKADRLQKGVIFVAKIINDTSIIDEMIKRNGKHEEYRFISEEEVDSFTESAVSDFKNTLKKVFSLWSTFFGMEEK